MASKPPSQPTLFSGYATCAPLSRTLGASFGWNAGRGGGTDLSAAATATAFLRVWVLGNFDARKLAFCRNAAAVHLAVGIGLLLAGFGAFCIVSPRFYLLLVLFTVASWDAVLAAVYLVRVRQPRGRVRSAEG